ncbi:MAG: DivIVA domain-containing protein [Oscillospiraceae bacterium]|jgi:cell division septum initiation protein DivIVA|nr:DivIVA domain-containing protein [Oscillospiraceae bacterium]
MPEGDRFQFGIFGYSKRDVDLRFDALQEDFSREKEAMLAERSSLQATIRELKRKEAELAHKENELRNAEGYAFDPKHSSEALESGRDRFSDISRKASKEIAGFRQDILNVRQNLNGLLSELQNRLDMVNSSLVGTINDMVMVKNEVTQEKPSSAADIQSEVDQLLRLAARDIITSPVSYYVPDSNSGSTLITSSAAKVMSSRINAYRGIAGDATSDGEVMDELRILTDVMENTSPTIPPSPPVIESKIELPQRFEEPAVPASSIIDNNNIPEIELAPAPDFEQEPITGFSENTSDPDWFANSPLTQNSESESFPLLAETKAVPVPVKRARTAQVTERRKARVVPVQRRATRG